MHYIPPIKQVLAGTALLSLMLLPACSTATRLGQLIPKHPNSELVKGEVAVAGYIRTKKFENNSLGADLKAPSDAAALGAGASAAAAAFIAGVAIDAVKKELDREAEKYEKQYTARTALTVEELGSRGTLLYIRCTDAMPRGSTREIAITKAIEGLSLQPGDDKTTLHSLVPENKVPQMVLAVNLTSNNSATTVYKAGNAKLWVAGVGAKVVGFNGKQPWTYLGGLLLKTGNEAEIDIGMTVKALHLKNLKNDKATWESSWVQVEPSATIVRGVKVKLGQPAVYSAGPKTGSWLPVPSVATGEAPLGFVEVSFNITEKDPSNVKQHIKEAADEIEENKASWIEKIKDQF